MSVGWFQVFVNSLTVRQDKVFNVAYLFHVFRSEANDLALRLARAHTHAEDAIVLDQYV